MSLQSIVRWLVAFVALATLFCGVLGALVAWPMLSGAVLAVSVAVIFISLLAAACVGNDKGQDWTPYQ